ncbi:DUF58 domain-containing protein [Membranihabitans marinus]|uniref:DUF58 domain-containing protein n=1 Tax=Membranihabitans marinus TaxID=1227546 RepID=UPI001F34BC73|nr:DUF58 domain-containing protein [Membranihabitans marinus]
MGSIEKYALHSVENFELLAKQVVEGFIIGLHQSPYHGFSAEFAEHKLYNPGETTKNIDWKVYGRTDKMFNKKYDDETNLRCQFVIDISSSMALDNRLKGMQKLSKLQWSALGTAAMIYLLKKQRDAFGLTLFDAEVSQHTPASGSLKQARLLLSYLEKFFSEEPVKSKSTDIAKSLHEIAERINKRSLVVIFSDFFDHMDELEPIFAALQHLKYNKNEVIIFNVVDKQKEVAFDFPNKPIQFVDYETGEKVKLRPGEIKELYNEHMTSFMKKLELKCLQFGIDYQLADINSDFNDVLRAFLLKRKRTRI